MGEARAHFVAGGIAGALGALCTCPLEVAKTRLQAFHNKEFLSVSKRSFFGFGVFVTLKDIAKQEGFFGLWKGIGPGLAGVAPARAIWFSTYQLTKQTTEEYFGTYNSKINFFSAIIAGVSVATITSPIWLVKTRMQLQTKLQDNANEYNYKNSFDCAKRVYQEEGFRGFYKGLGASYLGVSESSLQMVFYEKIRQSVQKRHYERLNSPKDVDFRTLQLDAHEQLIVGSFAKLIAAALTYPHEVIRTRMREQRNPEPGSSLKYQNIFQGLKLIAKEEGMRGLYCGLVPHLLKVVPNAAIMFYTYEFVVAHLLNKQKNFVK